MSWKERHHITAISEPDIGQIVLQAESASLPEEPRKLRRRIFGLAWPIIGENMLETSLDLVNTVLVAGLGAAALAGVGSAIQVMFFLLATLSVLSVGSSILVAQAIGAHDVLQAGRLARQSLLWSLVIAIPIALVGFTLAGPLVGIFGLPPEVARLGTDYLQVAVGTSVVLVALLIGGGVLRGAGDSRTPMLVTLVANIVNVGLAYGLIYGRFGLPELGAVGGAWAAFVSRSIALTLLLRALWRGRNGVSIAVGTSWRLDWSIARRVLGLGIPASLEQILMSSAWFMMTLLIAHLGTTALAVQRIGLSVMSVSFLPGVGLGLATTALVGQSIGARRPHIGRQVARTTTNWALLLMSSICLIIFVAAEPIMRVFTSAPEVIDLGVNTLRLMAIIQPFWGVTLTQAGALRGTGDTRSPLLIEAVGNWSMVLLAWLFLTFIGGGLLLVWSAFLITAPLTMLMMWYRYRNRARKLEEQSELMAP